MVISDDPLIVSAWLLTTLMPLVGALGEWQVEGIDCLFGNTLFASGNAKSWVVHLTGKFKIDSAL